MLGTETAKTFQESLLWRNHTHIGCNRFYNHRSHLSRCLFQKCFYAVQIIINCCHGILCAAFWYSGTVRDSGCHNSGTCFYQKCIGMSMIASGKFYDLIPSCITSGCTDCTHNSFCAGIDHTHHLNMRKMFTDKFRHLYFYLCSTSKAQTVCTCFNYCFPDLREVMTEDHRSPGIDIIYVFIAIYIINVTAICTFDKSRSHSDRTIRSDRTVDAARNSFYCTFK